MTFATLGALSVVRHLRRQRMRVVLSVTGVMLGVALVVATGTLATSAVQSMERVFETLLGPASIDVTGGDPGLPEELVSLVETVPGVADAAPVLFASVDVPDVPGIRLTVFGVDLLAHETMRRAQFSRAALQIVHPFDLVASMRAVVLSRTLASRLGVHAGDGLRVSTPDGSATLEVGGFLDGAGVAALFGGDVALMDLPAAQQMFHREGRVDVIQVLPVTGQEATVEPVLRTLLAGRASVGRAGVAASHLERLLLSTRVTFTLAALFACIVCAFLLRQTAMVSLARRVEEIALLGVVGFGRASITVTLIGESLLVGLVGTAAGVPIGVVLAMLCKDAFGTAIAPLVRMHIDAVKVDWTAVGAAVAIGLAMPVGVAIGPLVRAAGASPVRLLQRARGMSDGRDSRLHRVVPALGLAAASATALLNCPSSVTASSARLALITTALVGIFLAASWCGPAVARTVGLAWRRGNHGAARAVGTLAPLVLLRVPADVGATAAAIAVALAGVLSIGALVSSLRATLPQALEAALPGDFVVSRGLPLLPSTPPLSSRIGEAVRGVTGVMAVAGHRAALGDSRGHPVVIIGYDAAVSAAHGARITVINGDERDLLLRVARREGVMVSDTFSRRFGLGPGDTVFLSTPDGERGFPILAVVLDYSVDLGTVVLDASAYREFWGDASVTSYEVWAAPDEDPRALRQRVSERIGYAVPVLTSRDMRAEFDGQLDHAMSIAYATELASGVIALFSVVNFIVVATHDRRREIALWGAIGTSRRTIERILHCEACLVGGLGGLFGVLLGGVTSYLVVRGAVPLVSGWWLEYRFPGSAALLAVPITIAVAAVSAVLPARRAARLPLVEALGTL